ncbi:MAG: hypothetical protein AAGJ70_07665 [Pseudomonadota bacterium]
MQRTRPAYRVSGWVAAFIIVVAALGHATPALAQQATPEFKWQDGLNVDGFAPFLDGSIADPGAGATFNTTPLPNSTGQLDTGFFPDTPVSAPRAEDRSFSGFRLRLAIEAQ